MAGYVPLFDSLTKGTLCGRWPDIGLWPIVLSMSDKNGVVDVTPTFIAGVTGLPEPEVVACMARFCEPDKYSRSSEANGARLILLDSHRDWGWRIVNHRAYREKARLMGKNEREVESGKNQERKTAAHRRSPPPAAADPPSYADADAYSDKEKDNGEERAVALADRKIAPEGAMAIALRDLGVTVKSTDPVLHDWLRDGFTVQQAVDAVGIARIRKPHPEAIHPNYLNTILRAPQRAPPKPIDRVTWRPTDEESSGVSERV